MTPAPICRCCSPEGNAEYAMMPLASVQSTIRFEDPSATLWRCARCSFEVQVVVDQRRGDTRLEIRRA